jgi:hypothetical protein
MTATVSPVRVERSRPSVRDTARLAAFKRKFPWAWWCTSCPGAYGADRTEELAQAQASAHAAAAHLTEGN